MENEEKAAVSPVVEKGIPLPPLRPRGKNIGRRIAWPFMKMEIGDSFLLPEWAEENRAFASISKMRKEGKLPRAWNFSARTVDGSVRIWRTS